MSCCDYGCNQGKDCPARQDKAVQSIRHSAQLDPPPLQIPWQVVAVLLVMCCALAGYAVQVFSK
jgi:hypothetical protein